MCNNPMLFHSRKLCSTTDTKVLMHRLMIKNIVKNIVVISELSCMLLSEYKYELYAGGMISSLEMLSEYSHSRSTEPTITATFCRNRLV